SDQVRRAYGCNTEVRGQGSTRLKHQSVVIIRKNDFGAKILRVFLRHCSVGYNNDNISHLGTTGSSTVQTNCTGSTFSFDHVSNQTLAIVIIDYMYLFILYQAGGLH